MRGTVKQFKDMLQEMKTIYPYDDEKTYLSTDCVRTMSPDRLEIRTVDEKTGVTIVMAKDVERGGEY